ncbi:hypothetical protein CQA53_06095 [Helicobacter didelphidarum]|uniref:Flagellar protein FlgN n=1 Tax=Helicobacter didelphidarum TaxID=2040648 RepID=A0A3D8IKJ4_9HELI|nr:hypothetical protein [Helicobacter didelphidarum]RDU65729.1 hypothetical protein CQA53_06095 [Helicobacter didelphidarum]
MINTELLHTYLQDAINKLQSLITFTKDDIEDIKQAKHEAVFHRSILKTSAIKEFELAKGMIDQEILSLTQKHPHLKLAEILDEKANVLLGDMRSMLEELKSSNTHYARIVFAVSEFYTSMADKLIPREKADYKSRVEQSQLLRVQA